MTDAPTVDQEGVVHLIATENGEDITSLVVPNGTFEALEFSRDGKRLAGGGSWAGKVHIVLWDLENRTIENQWDWEIGKDPVTGVEEIRFSRDDAKLAVAVFRQDAAYLIDLSSADRKKLRHKNVYGLSFSADDNQLVTAGWDSHVRRWDALTGEPIGAFEVPKWADREDTRMYTVCCDPFGGQIATALLGREIRILAEEDFSMLRKWIPDARFTFGAMRYSPDGVWLASGDTTGKICIWDPSTGEKLREIQAHGDHVYVVGFGKGNRLLCSGGANVGYVWDLKPRELQIESCDDAAQKLLRGEPKEAYRAWWFLIDQGDEAVDELMAQVDQVERVTDIDGQIAGSEASQRERREKLLRQALAKDKTAIGLPAARRVVSVLSHIDTKMSLKALEQLASMDDGLGKVAAWELKRRDRMSVPKVD